LISVKGNALAIGQAGSCQEINLMPASAIPFVSAVIGAFAFFIIIVGGAAFWTSMPGPLRRNVDQRLDHDL
jgi:hypothetical protein